MQEQAARAGVRSSETLAREDARREAAHAALVRVLPGIEGHARRLIPADRAGHLAVAGEDLVQFAAQAALSRLEGTLSDERALPDWWQSDERLAGYLRGVAWRRLQRILRDQRDSSARAEVDGVAAGTEPEPLFRREERALARTCLAGLRAGDLRMFGRFARGASCEELAPRLRLSASALAKRRGRVRAAMRERCSQCRLRRDHGCPWVPRGWLDPV